MRGAILAIRHIPENNQSPVGSLLLLGGANGGLLGPAGGLWADLGQTLAKAGAAVLRLHYRRPGKLEECLLDAAAMAELELRTGADKLIFCGHSFGGAVAIQAGVALGQATAGVAALATQSAGCESVQQLDSVPLLLVHGDEDQVLTPDNSLMVNEMANSRGEIKILRGASHGLNEAREELLELLSKWTLEQLA